MMLPPDNWTGDLNPFSIRSLLVPAAFFRRFGDVAELELICGLSKNASPGSDEKPLSYPHSCRRRSPAGASAVRILQHRVDRRRRMPHCWRPASVSQR